MFPMISSYKWKQLISSIMKAELKKVPNVFSSYNSFSRISMVLTAKNLDIRTKN